MILTEREKQLVDGVNARLAQKRKDERARRRRTIWKLVGLVVGGGLLAALQYFAQTGYVGAVVNVVVTLGGGIIYGLLVMLGDQHKTILRLEERIRALEAHPALNSPTPSTASSARSPAGTSLLAQP